jgi:hypothetical protein
MKMGMNKSSVIHGGKGPASRAEEKLVNRRLGFEGARVPAAPGCLITAYGTAGSRPPFKLQRTEGFSALFSHTGQAAKSNVFSPGDKGCQGSFEVGSR